MATLNRSMKYAGSVAILLALPPISLQYARSKRAEAFASFSLASLLTTSDRRASVQCKDA